MSLIEIGILLLAFFGGVLATAIVYWRLKDRKIVAWTVVAESELLTRKVVSSHGLPVKILVDDKEQKSVAAVIVRLGSGGNTTIGSFSLIIRVNREAEILRARYLDSLGEFEKKISMTINQNSVEMFFDFLNPEVKEIDLELLVGDYEEGMVVVDMSAPGVVLEKREATRWNVQTSIFSSLALSVMGVRYDPTVSSLREIADELRSLRRYATKSGAVSSVSRYGVEAGGGENRPGDKVRVTQMTGE